MMINSTPPVLEEKRGENIEVFTSDPESEQESVERKLDFAQVWDSLVRLGLGEVSVKIGTALLSIALFLLVVWVMGNFYLKSEPAVQKDDPVLAAAIPTLPVEISPPLFDIEVSDYFISGISREIQIHTILPAKPRFELTTYVVQPGDTIIGIGDKFNIKPETVFWGNPYTLSDDPHRLAPGQELVILPFDGVYYEWHAGDGLNGVAQFFGVTPEDIINYGGNNLDLETIGDYANPNIEPGTWLIVPGGTKEFINWSAPRITRNDPAVARVYGPGYCGEVYEGPIGNGTFVWPAVETYISGYDYSPETNHSGIDIAGDMGHAIYATDSGVVVYAGWNDHGYGYVVVIDHGNGWQSLYAHLSAYNVECGSHVYQGDVIAGMGSTGNSSGPHLHFELRSDLYGKVNPWNFLR